MRIHFLLGMIILPYLFTSCGSARECPYTIVDYDRMLFSNGEYSTLLSIYNISDTVWGDSVKDGFCLLRGNVYIRDALGEICGQNTSKKVDKYSIHGDWPHLILPSLGMDLIISDGSFYVNVPVGTYDVILIAEDYYPIHFNWDFISRHTYSIDFYLGCTFIH